MFFLIGLSFFSYAQEPACEVSGQYGCEGDNCASSLCAQEGFEICNVALTPIAGDWSCHVSQAYIIPEFAPVPGLLTFFSSLGIPYWLFRRRK